MLFMIDVKTKFSQDECTLQKAMGHCCIRLLLRVREEFINRNVKVVVLKHRKKLKIINNKQG